MGEPRLKWREDLKIFRERMGGVTPEKRAWSKEQRDVTKAIREALKGGPRTIPEIAALARLPSPTVMWYVMAMKRYGKIAEAGQAGDYYRYELKEASS
jgi:predicted transcriptional regulator